MLTYFQNDIARKRDDIIAYLSEEFKDLNEHTVRVKKQDIHLRMIRGFVKQLLIHFEWGMEGKPHER